jgi:hypothetical protein
VAHHSEEAWLVSTVVSGTQTFRNQIHWEEPASFTTGRSESRVRSRLQVCCMATFDIDGIAPRQRIKVV